MSDELYKKYRPKSFKDVLGQPEAVKVLSGFLKSGNVPRFILLTGSSGTGKTSLARIMKDKLSCSDRDFVEINAADSRGIDTVREIRSLMSLSPMGGTCRIWLVDECHRLTGDSMGAFLKILEDTPSHVYFFFATTNPEKLLPTIRTRATEVKVNSLPHSIMKELLTSTCEKEDKKVSDEVIERIIECSEGSARTAMVNLNKIINLKSEEEQLSSILSNDVKRQVGEIFKLLLNPKSTWGEMCKIIKEIDEEPEKIRHYVLAAATNVILGNPKNHNRVFRIIFAFEGNFFDSKKAGLIRACYEVISQP